MFHSNGDAFRTAFTVTVDAKEGVSTGISRPTGRTRCAAG